MKKIPKNGVKGKAQFGNYWVANSFMNDYKLPCRIFSEDRAMELLRIEKHFKMALRFLSTKSDENFDLQPQFIKLLNQMDKIK